LGGTLWHRLKGFYGLSMFDYKNSYYRLITIFTAIINQ